MVVIILDLYTLFFKHFYDVFWFHAEQCCNEEDQDDYEKDHKNEQGNKCKKF